MACKGNESSAGIMHACRGTACEACKHRSTDSWPIVKVLLRESKLGSLTRVSKINCYYRRMPRQLHYIPVFDILEAPSDIGAKTRNKCLRKFCIPGDYYLQGNIIPLTVLLTTISVFMTYPDHMCSDLLAHFVAIRKAFQRCKVLRGVQHKEARSQLWAKRNLQMVILHLRHIPGMGFTLLTFGHTIVLCGWWQARQLASPMPHTRNMVKSRVYLHTASLCLKMVSQRGCTQS